MFRESMTKEELAELPLAQFTGDIILVETPGMAEIAAGYLRNFPVLGFDTETKPSFTKGEIHKVALLQLATEERAFLIRLQKVGLPDSIRKILSDPRQLKTGVAIRDDLKALQKVRNFRPEGFVELQDMAVRSGIRDFSLKKLCAILLGVRISKAQQTSNWESESLSDQQLVYAATDAYMSLKIFEKFNNSQAGEGV
ncbi:MAG TPA: 3'-5' exonuclease [Prolixibacteraceae bacterium]|nr:3'-5' exonuclease [Prolixibacteraceae bacterium]